MSDRPRLSELSREQLLSRAAEYRAMAATATTADVRDALVRVAERLEGMAKVLPLCP
jgi:hypothetical protein